MKIDVDPQILRQIEAYCDEQQGVMDATKAYLDQHGKISLGDFGLLLMIARPFYELCRGVTMSGFGLGAKLVKSRATAIHDYLEEQTAMESDNQSIWDQLNGALGQTGQGPWSGGGGGGAHNARPVGPGIPNFQDPLHSSQELNPQPLPPIDRPGDSSQLVNPQPNPPAVDGQAQGIEHMQEELNPQPPGPPPETLHQEALSDRQEVMDRVWQDRSNDDPLGRSPDRLRELWQARQPVEPSAIGDQSLQMQAAGMDKMQNLASNIMKLASDTQMAMLAKAK